MDLINENDLKICDFERRGNVVRFYLTQLDDNDYWGDDWNDVPYELNAGTVSDWHPYVEFAFPLKIWVTEPADDWHYKGNSPFSKEDFKARKAPCLLIGNLEDEWRGSYSEQMGNENLLRIYYGDEISNILAKVKEYGGLIIFEEDPDGKR